MPYDVATRTATPVVIGLAGMSGSGKTLSALLLARGLVGDMEDVIFLDTEKGRGQLYADDARVAGYRYGRIDAPFTSDSFVDEIKKAAEAGAKCIIVDSVSHEWTGIGGCLEQVDDMVAKKGDKVKMLAWAKVAPQHRRLVNEINAPRCHLILCMRARHKTKPVKDKQTGKTEIVTSDHLIAEQREDFIYEMTAAAVIDQQHQATWDGAEGGKCPAPLINVLQRGVITPAQGEAIRDWVNGGTPRNEEAERHLSEMRALAFDEGTEAVTKYWTDNIKGKADQAVLAALRPQMDNIKADAKRRDEIRAREEGITANDQDADEKRENPLATEGTA